MDVDFAFDVRERTFKGVRGVRDVEMRVVLEGEEPGKVCLKTPIGTPKTCVGEVPSTRAFINGFLTEKILPLLVPEFQPVSETRSIGLRQKENKFLQFLPRFEFGFPRDVPQDDLHLVELTHLNWNARKGFHKAFPGIADNPYDVPSLPFQLLDPCHILGDGFIRKKLPEEVSMTMWTPECHHPKDFLEVRRVHHHNDTACFEQTGLNSCLVYLMLHPPSAPFEPLSNLCVGLFPMSVDFPEVLHLRHFLLSYFVTARFAKPQLPSTVRSKLLQFTGIATRTYFS